MQWPRAVTVHGFAQASAALARGRPVTLLSGRGAAVYGGVGWWRALVEAARRAYPNTHGGDILDCADAPGAAMAALRCGQAALVLDPTCPAFAAVAAAASARGAAVLAARPASLDLADPAASRRLQAWLAVDDSAPGLGIEPRP
jgi:hypothetical protein